MSQSGNDFEKTFGPLFANVIRASGKMVQPAEAQSSDKGDVSVSQQSIEALKAKVVEQYEVLRRLTEGALLYALVIAVLPAEQNGTAPTLRRVVILLEGKQFEVAFPGETEVSPGDTVKLTRDSFQIVAVADFSLAKAGGVAIVTGKNDEWTTEVLVDGNSSVVYNGKFKNLVPGDRVVLDSSKSVVVKNIGVPNLGLLSAPATPVDWSEIIGQEEAIRVLKEAIELPVTCANYFAHYGRKPPKGILLFGSPGCGKTMLGKAAATAQAKIHDQKLAGSGFIYIRGPEFLSKFVGVAEADIRQVFAAAREHFKRNGYQCIIFFDEAEAMFSKRGTGISSDIEKTIVPTLLTEMDGFEEGGPIVILATNRPDLLDPAIVRDKRIDRKINVMRPGQVTALQMFKNYLRRVPLVDAILEEASLIASLELFSDRYGLYEIPLSGGVDGKGETLRFLLGNLASGAMIASIVEQASGIAMERDIASKEMTGVRLEDLKQAVASVYGQNVNLGHTDELEIFLEDVRERVLPGFRKLRQATV